MVKNNYELYYFAVLVFLGTVIITGCTEKKDSLVNPYSSKDTLSVTLIGSIKCCTGPTWDVKVADNFAYVAGDGLAIIDITDPSSPILSSYLQIEGEEYHVEIINNMAYLSVSFRSDAGGRLYAINVSDRTNPNIIGFVAWGLGSVLADLAVFNNYAFVVDREVGGVNIVDISDPNSLSQISSFQVRGQAGAISISGNQAYILSNNYLNIMNISDPLSAIETGYCVTDLDPYSIYLSEDHVFIVGGEGSASLKIIDVSNPLQPTVQGTYNLGYPWDVTVVDNFAFIADNGGGLKIVNVSDPTSPIYGGHYNTQGDSRSVTVNGEHVFVADEEYLLIFVIE